MKQSITKIKLYWGKKEKDWKFSFPDTGGRTMMGIFFEMMDIQKNIRFLQPSSINKELPQSLKRMLFDRGYDFRTLKLTVNKIKAEDADILKRIIEEDENKHKLLF